MFSKACEYGIRAILYIAQQSLKDNRVGLKRIAKEINSPEAFTAKILQQLAKYGIIDSTKGPNGGFAIKKEKLHSLKLSDVVNAIDGDSIYKGCALGLEECDEEHPCPIHHQFKSIRDNLGEMLISTNLEDLAVQLEKGSTHLKR